MFGFGKGKKKETNAANLRLAKKIPGKDSGRRVFGFPCSPDVPANLKVLADQLNVPIFALAEHELELANELIAKIAERPEDREELRKHLVESHIDVRAIEKIGPYNREMADQMVQELRRRFEIDRAARQIVVRFIRVGVKPSEIVWAIDYGIRCRIAVAHGGPIPKDFPPEV
jgi:hypothetical protein